MFQQIKQMLIRQSASCDQHLVLYVDHPIALAQIDGLRTVAHALEIKLCCYVAKGFDIGTLNSGVVPSVIWLQSWWDSPEDELRALVQLCRARWPEAKIIYLDWFAPTDLRNTYLFDLCDLYVKKNVLADLTEYAAGFSDTNLAEFEARYSERFLRSPHDGIDVDRLHEKLRLGWSFATQYRLQKLLKKDCYKLARRPFDVHCRIASPKDFNENWYAHMRYRSLKAAEALPFPNVLAQSELLSWRKYIGELKRSKICFSPFGYGEVCWRDFEAIAAGALLVKPDMGHMRSAPDIYQPYVTYIP
ncbi:MAG TPA: hypothetical protein VIC26_01320, partial [Marinagarivorans sp.]